MNADAIVVGHGLAGLVATAELADAGRKVLLVDQESEANLGGQAHWSFGGLFFVDSPEQRRLGIKDSAELAHSDWMNTAGFDREEDHWPRQWAQAYLDFAGGEKRAWLHEQGMRWFPIVGWAERGDGSAHGHGNSVPRFHITWGTGPGVVAPFVRRVEQARERGLVTYAHRHRVDEIIVEGGAVVGVRGVELAPDGAERGVATNRDSIGGFELRAPVVLVASGGIGGNHDLVRANWPERLGTPPKHMVTGVPAHVDGRMIGITEAAGGNLINRDRMWHYVEGIRNWDPIWAQHGIRILPGPSSMWLDAEGTRLPAPLLPGYDTLGTLAHLRATGHDHSWFITNRSVAGKEFALSGSEQNQDLTGKEVAGVIRKRSLADVTPSMQAFLDKGADFVMADTVEELVARMNDLVEEGEPRLDVAHVKRQLDERDGQLDNAYSKDAQIAAMRVARSYIGDKISKRAYPPHKLQDPKKGPLVGVKLHVLSRKTLGGFETDLGARVLGRDGEVIRGLYAAGEAAGFGGGGVHGYRALEGTFLGGCIFSGRSAGRTMAQDLGD
ncbi:FAD-binding dehydrogenase [Janibacter indicus]|uniref:FAD-binding dehydrogenase n=1 Tax=Janibacter indicus TaxID=857417 RepID=A0A1L3MJU1_9MICO|nr:FAD-binding dehydrogenase [Janibacter indicus]APH02653.1 FAD-binding dehydrogenase [Janibacter indicus]QOK22624.1 FAD-binding dehydrogenase [Janibacter indicus]